MNNVKFPLIMEILRDWYLIDSVLLNDHAKYCITDDKDYEEFVSLKAALLSDLYEFYKHIGYEPNDKKILENHRQLQREAIETAKKTKSVSARMIESVSFKDHMKKVIIKEFEKSKNKKDIRVISENIINERFLKMCLDNMLIGIPVVECSDKDKTSDFKGEILEQAYLTVRSELVKLSKKYSNSFYQKKPLTEISAALMGFKLFAGFLLAGAAARAIEAFSNRCENRCGTLSLNTAAKRACVLKCKIQTQQKIIAALRQSAAQTNNPVARNKFAKDVKRAQLRMTQYQRQLARIAATRAGSGKLEPGERARAF